MQVKGLSAAASSVRSYGGARAFGDEAAALRREMTATAQDLDGALQELAG